MSHTTYVALEGGLWAVQVVAVAVGLWASLTRRSGGILLLVALLTWLVAAFLPAGRYLLILPLLAAALGVIRLARPSRVSAAVLIVVAVAIYVVTLSVRH